MKKNIICLFLFMFGSFVLFGQDTVYVNGVPKITKKNQLYGESDEVSPLVKDDYLLEVSYGLPFSPLQEASFIGVDFFSDTKSIKERKNSNHLCFNADYQLSKEFSVGLEMTYATMRLDYYRTFTTYPQPVNGFIPPPVVTDSAYSARTTKFRFLAKLSYHLNISERFDAFGTAGFGYKQFSYSSADYYLNTNNYVNTLLPLAIRVSVGGRFFINKNFAIHIEGGLGGPLMQIGLTYKLHSYAYDSKNK